MQVALTADHLARGIRYTISRCPFALGLEEATGRQWAVYPWPEDACAWTLSSFGAQSMRISLPEDALDFILAFDAGEKVEPRVFEIPDRPLQRAGSPGGGP